MAAGAGFVVPRITACLFCFSRRPPFGRINRFHLIFVTKKAKFENTLYRCNFDNHEKRNFISVGEIQCSMLEYKVTNSAIIIATVPNLYVNNLQLPVIIYLPTVDISPSLHVAVIVAKEHQRPNRLMIRDAR